MPSFRKISEIKFLREYIFSILLLYTIILNGKEFFHNHEYSLIEPENCPVYIFSVNTKSDLVNETPSELFVPFQNFTPQQSSLTALISKQTSLHLRAPPTLF